MNMKRIICITGAFAVFIFLIAYNASDFEKRKAELELKRLMETTVITTEATDIWDVIKESQKQQQQNTVTSISDGAGSTQTSITDTFSEAQINETALNETNPEVTTVPEDTAEISETTKKTIFTTPAQTTPTEPPTYTIRLQ